MSKVIITIGIPASGKSTWASEFVEANPDWVKTGRDDFRYMLQNKGVCSGQIENIITKSQSFLVDELVKSNVNVIIDNTHVHRKYIEHWINLLNQQNVEIYTLQFDISLTQAISRDKLRQRSVGVNVITSMYNSLQTLDISNLNLKEWQL
jgi:predicted kinase